MLSLNVSLSFSVSTLLSRNEWRFIPILAYRQGSFRDPLDDPSSWRLQRGNTRYHQNYSVVKDLGTGV